MPFRRLVSLGLVACVAGLLGPIPVARAHRFGDVPLMDVKDAARDANRCTGLTSAELASMVLAPTWEEVAPGPTLTPSPMTLSRHDRDNDLYSPWNLTPRAFYHPGIGAWQLDHAGLGASMSAFQMINTKSAAGQVANTMASNYCNESGTALQRRRAAFSPWFGCGNSQSDCEVLYQEHYCSATDNVCGITQVSGVGRFGGMKQRTCTYRAGPPPYTDFTCWFIDPDKAEGYTGSWQQTPLGGNSSLSPLAFAFYSHWTSTGYESRHWLEADTGYARGEIRALRQRGDNPRTAGAVLWYDDPDALCDEGFQKGAC